MEDALRDLPRSGRPKEISSEARAWIISIACMKPKDLGYPHELWTLLAGIDLITGNIHHKVFDNHRSKEFIEFLRYLNEVYPSYIKITTILDNLKVHTSKETKKYLMSVPNRFHFVFTPKHASWLNIIETLFSKMTRSMLRGIRVGSKNELIDRIDEYFNYLNKTQTIFALKYKMDEMRGDI